MLYLLAFFISPLAVLFAGSPIQAMLNAIIYIFSFFGLLLFFIPGIILWFIGVAHAFVVISNKKADRRHKQLVEAVQNNTKAG